MIINQYLECLKGLENNINIELIDDSTQKETADFTSEMLMDEKEDLDDMGSILLTDKGSEAFSLTSVSIGWDSTLLLGDVILRGGFVFNGITDSLLFPSDFWKGGISLAPDTIVPDNLKHYEKLNWFEHLPVGIGDSKRGCFIREEGNFPPPIAFYNGGGWYTKLDFDYYKYLELLFQNYGFKGWQFFYIDITADMPKLDEVIEDMRVAIKTLPLLFPDKDWSYHKKRYEDILNKLG